MAVFIYKSMPSTNSEVAKPGYRHGDAVIAREQTAGRGQRGNKWSSKAGENLTFSLVWEPTFMEAKRQFLLSEAVALALVDTLKEYDIRPKIKWTNDIYVGNKKICGILIENALAVHTLDDGAGSLTLTEAGDVDLAHLLTVYLADGLVEGLLIHGELNEHCALLGLFCFDQVHG